MQLALIVCTALSGILSLIVGVPIAQPELQRWPRLAWLDRSRFFVAAGAVLCAVVCGVLAITDFWRHQQIERTVGPTAQISAKATLDAIDSEIVNTTVRNASEARHFFRIGDDLLRKKEYAAAATAYQHSVDSLATKSALTNLALALRYSSESEKSVNAARRAIEIQPFDGVLHANALLQLAIGLTELGKREEARLRLEDAFKRFSDAKNALGIGATEYALGVFEYRGGNAKQAETWLKSAHTRFAAENDKPSQAAVMNVLGVMKLDSGATDDGIRSLREAIALFRETSDPTGEAGALLNIGTARQDKCELADALSAYGECANAAKVVKNYALAAFAVGNESSALLEDGKFVEARQKAQETLGLCHLVESPEAEGWAHVYIATAANRQGQFDEAVRESLLARQKLQDVNAAGLLAVAMEEARTAIGTRRLSDASIILDAAQKTASEPHFELYLPAVLSVVAELREAEGDVVKTREALTAARDMNVRHGIRNCEARRIEQRLAALTATTAGPPRSSARTQSTVPDARAGG